MKSISVLLTSVFLLIFCPGCNEDPKELSGDPYPAGLYIENGLLMRNGKPFYGIGANYYDMFVRSIGSNDLSGMEGLEGLAAAGIPFARFSACAYAPAGWKYYLNDPEKYFHNLDRLVAKAEEVGVGLIPSLFWFVATIPDVAGEPMDGYEDPEGETIALVKRYTRDIVSRYAGSPAIWGWEFGNEFSLEVDIPHRPTPPLLPGSPPRRDPRRDVLTQKGMLTAFEAFAEVVREYDTVRPLFSGNDSPRYGAYHNSHPPMPIWGLDSEEQYREMVSVYESPINTVTTRGYYDNHTHSASMYPMSMGEFTVFLAWLKNYCREIGKPLFLGEFGPRENYFERLSSPYDRERTTREQWQMRIDAVVENRVQLSAFWNWDYASGDPTQPRISHDHDSDGVLEMVARANALLDDHPPRWSELRVLIFNPRKYMPPKARPGRRYP